jgi:hypothetical protein
MKFRSEIFRTEAGMQIDFSELHPVKENPDIARSLDPDSKLILSIGDESGGAAQQRETKRCWGSDSRETGKQINFSDLQPQKVDE